MYKKERRIGSLIIDSHFNEIKQRGFKDIRLLTDWHLIFKNSTINPQIFKPIKQKDDQIIFSTSDMNFYNKFQFLKSEILTNLKLYFGEDFVKRISIKIV